MSRLTNGVAWAVGGLASLALCARALSPAPMPAQRHATPPPLPRPASSAEQADVARAAARMQAEIDQARQRLGRALRLSELEGSGPDGVALLPGGLTDNPLVEGTAGVGEWCSGGPPPPALDWLYCPETGDIRPGLTTPTTP